MESLKNMYEEFGICDAIYEFGQKTEEKLKARFDAIDKNAEYNQLKVLHAMQKNFPEVPDMATTMTEGIRWKRYMRIHFTRKMHW
mgnify:CR=1 FL=1